MRLCSRLLNRAADQSIEPAAVGVGTAGQVDVARGGIVSVTSNIPGWGGSAVGEELQKRFGLPVLVENDGNAFALGDAVLIGSAAAALLSKG
jgi:glucokinase